MLFLVGGGGAAAVVDVVVVAAGVAAAAVVVTSALDAGAVVVVVAVVVVASIVDVVVVVPVWNWRQKLKRKCCLQKYEYLLLQAFVPSVHEWSALGPQLLNQEPPRAQQLSWPESVTPHSRHTELGVTVTGVVSATAIST